MRIPTALVSMLMAAHLAAAESVVTVELVRVIDGRVDETLYFYQQNNWAAHRQKAKVQGFIADYRLLLDRDSGDETVLMLVTEYGDREQYDVCEANFASIIDAAGDRKLLNDLAPREFREFTSAWTFDTLD